MHNDRGTIVEIIKCVPRRLIRKWNSIFHSASSFITKKGLKYGTEVAMKGSERYARITTVVFFSFPCVNLLKENVCQTWLFSHCSGNGSNLCWRWQHQCCWLVDIWLSVLTICSRGDRAYLLQFQHQGRQLLSLTAERSCHGKPPKTVFISEVYFLTQCILSKNTSLFELWSRKLAVKSKKKRKRKILLSEIQLYQAMEMNIFRIFFYQSPLLSGWRMADLLVLSLFWARSEMKWNLPQR